MDWANKLGVEKLGPVPSRLPPVGASYHLKIPVEPEAVRVAPCPQVAEELVTPGMGHCACTCQVRASKQRAVVHNRPKAPVLVPFVFIKTA